MTFVCKAVHTLSIKVRSQFQSYLASDIKCTNGISLSNPLPSTLTVSFLFKIFQHFYQNLFFEIFDLKIIIKSFHIQNIKFILNMVIFAKIWHSFIKIYLYYGNEERYPE